MFFSYMLPKVTLLTACLDAQNGDLRAPQRLKILLKTDLETFFYMHLKRKISKCIVIAIAIHNYSPVFFMYFYHLYQPKIHFYLWSYIYEITAWFYTGCYVNWNGQVAASPAVIHC